MRGELPRLCAPRRPQGAQDHRPVRCRNRQWQGQGRVAHRRPHGHRQDRQARPRHAARCAFRDRVRQAGRGSDVPHVRDRGIAGHLDLFSLGHGPAICGAHQRRRAAGAPELNCRGVWGLEHLIAVMLGLAFGLWLATRAGWKVAWPHSWRLKLGAPVASPLSTQASPPGDAAAASLSARLHSLEAVYAPLASNLAHPRELEDQPQFREAVTLLEDLEVPLDTVMQYALGANWPLACAALAALTRRADRSERSGEVVAHFEKLYPWPIHFALEYLLAVEPRPPV